MDLFLVSLVLYLFVGGIAGLAGGLLGIGGGSLTVPALLLLFSFLGFPQDHIMHLAIGTSLSAMVINTLSATYFHHKKKAVQWVVVKRAFLGILVGSVVGIFFAKLLSSDALQIIFGVFACLIGFVFAKPIQIAETHKMPSFPVLSLVGSSISCVSNLLGIGGGFFMVPLLTYFDFNEKKAIGTSCATSFLISLCGATGYFILAENQASIPFCVGYVYIPAFLAISLSSFFASFYGVKLAHILPARILRKIFAATMIAIGLSMVLAA